MGWISRLGLAGLLGAMCVASFPPATAEAARARDLRALMRCRNEITDEGLACHRWGTARLERCIEPLTICQLGGKSDPSCARASWQCARLDSDMRAILERMRSRVRTACGNVPAVQLSDELGFAECASDKLDTFVDCLVSRCRRTVGDAVVGVEPATCRLLANAGYGAVLPSDACTPPPPPPPPPASGPLYCGGPDAVTCPTGMVCDRTDALCSATAPVGRCMPAETTCDDDGMPVCGCDGVTYGSECARRVAGMVKMRDGACDPPPTACGNADGDCPSGMFCDYPQGDCGEGQAGVCRPMRAEPCNMCSAYVRGPVCGCNFVTYANDCEREAAGQSLFWSGSCM